MAVPFRRTSKTKKRMRRTHLKKEASTLTTCKNCGATIQPHRMCTKCGFYKGKEVVTKKEEVVEEVKVAKKATKAKATKKDVKKTATPKPVKVTKKASVKRTADK